jgi:hypothetical protein
MELAENDTLLDDHTNVDTSNNDIEELDEFGRIKHK